MVTWHHLHDGRLLGAPVVDGAPDDRAELALADHLVGEVDEVPGDLPDVVADAAVEGGGAGAAAAVGALVVKRERVTVLKDDCDIDILPFPCKKRFPCGLALTVPNF